jgi:hypothetical protein
MGTVATSERSMSDAAGEVVVVAAVMRQTKDVDVCVSAAYLCMPLSEPQ